MGDDKNHDSPIYVALMYIFIRESLLLSTNEEVHRAGHPETNYCKLIEYI